MRSTVLALVAIAAAAEIFTSGLASRVVAARERTQTNVVQIQRFSVITSRPFDAVVATLTASIGHPDMKAFHEAIVAETAADLERTIHAAIGPSQLMQFASFDAGEVLRKEQNGQGPKILRLLIGNPLIMQEMASTVPDAAAYAPVTVLVDERADGVHLSYDSMASLLAPYGSEAANAVARDLDAKVEDLLVAAANDAD